MASIYKYMPSKYLQAFLGGTVRFRTLAYFQAYEADQVRGDRIEGTHIYKPVGGLVIDNHTAGQLQHLDMHFRTTVRTTEMFVFCASQVSSVDLAREFKSDVCVEIFRPDLFVAKIRSALQQKPSTRKWKLIHDSVVYRNVAEPSGIDWALPDRIAMTKRLDYAYQREYRFLFARARIFDVENVKCELVSNDLEPPVAGEHRTDYDLNLGDLSKICRVHQMLGCLK